MKTPFIGEEEGELTVRIDENYNTDIRSLMSKIYYDIDISKASKYIKGELKMKKFKEFEKVETKLPETLMMSSASLDYYDLMKFAEKKRAQKLEKKEKRKIKERKKQEEKDKIFDFGPIEGIIDKDEIPIGIKKNKKDDIKEKKNRDSIKIGDYVFYTSKMEPIDTTEDLLSKIIPVKSDHVNLYEPMVTKRKKKKSNKGFFDDMPYMDLKYSMNVLDSITEDDEKRFENNVHEEWKSKKYKNNNKRVVGGGRSIDEGYTSIMSKKEKKKYKKDKKQTKKEKEWNEWYNTLDDNYITPRDIEFVPTGLTHKERKKSLESFQYGEKLCKELAYPNNNKFAKKVIKAYKNFFSYLDRTIYSSLYANLSDEAKNNIIDNIFIHYNKIQDIIWKEMVNYEKFLYNGERVNTDCPNPFLVGVERKIKIIDSLFYSIKDIDKLKKKYVVYDFSISKKEAKKLDKIRIKNLELMRDCLIGTFFSRSRDNIIDSIEVSKILRKFQRKQVKKYDTIRKGLAAYEVKISSEDRKEVAELREAQRRQILKEAEEHIKSKYGDVPVQYFDEEVQEEILGHKVPKNFYQNLEYNTALENLEDMNDNWNKNQVFYEITGRRGNTFPEFKDRHQGLPNNSYYASAIADYGATPEELEKDYPGCYDKAIDNDNKRWKKVYQRLKTACEAAERIRINNNEDILEDKLDDIINAELDKIDSETLDNWKDEKGVISVDQLDNISRYF